MTSIKNGNVVIDFYHNNKRYRVMTIYKNESKDIKLAEKLCSRIKLDLEYGKFYLANYKQFFKNPKLLADLDAHFEYKKTRQLLGDLLNEQLTRYESRKNEDKLAIATYQAYQGTITTRLMPVFKNVELADITPQDLDEFIKNLHLSRTRINFIIRPLKEIYRRSKKLGIIKDDPFDGLDKFDLNNYSVDSDYTPEPFSTDEKEKIIAAADGQLKNLIQFAFWSGMRLGEIMALTWDDVDFTAGIVRVNKTLTIKQIIKKPKTKAGVRDVELTPLAEIALRSQQAFTGNDTDRIVFKNTFTNKPWSKPGVFGRWWKKILSKAKVKYRNPHQMRHTFISYMLLVGNRPEIIYKIVGHENTLMIYKVYGKYIAGETKGKLLKV